MGIYQIQSASALANSLSGTSGYAPESAGFGDVLNRAMDAQFLRQRILRAAEPAAPDGTGDGRGRVGRSRYAYTLLSSLLGSADAECADELIMAMATQASSMVPSVAPMNSGFGESNAIGAKVLSLAASRLGDPYSQALAGQGRYTDCSYLTQYCYRQAGVSLPRTAAEQARYCVDNGYTISKEELAPGDLIFFSHKENGRYRNITHVAVYAGDGMVVDASYSKGQVVKRPLYSGQVLYARPR